MEHAEVSWGRPPTERADAARNRENLITTAREMLAELGADQITMDALAERSGLGKGTVYRRFGTRAGIFQALLDDGERALQTQMLSGPPPLGPGAPPLERLVAYGEARIGFLLEHHTIARAALDGRQPVPGGGVTALSQAHIGMLLAQIDLGRADIRVLAIQLAAALEGPLLLLLSSSDLEPAPCRLEQSLADGWNDLVRRVCRP